MGISKSKSVYNCFRCGSKGHVLQLIKKLNRGSSSGFAYGGTSSSNEHDDGRFNSQRNNENDNYEPRSKTYNDNNINFEGKIDTQRVHDNSAFSDHSNHSPQSSSQTNNSTAFPNHSYQNKNTFSNSNSHLANQSLSHNNPISNPSTSNPLYHQNSRNLNQHNYQNINLSQQPTSVPTPAFNSRSVKSTNTVSNISLLYEMFKRIQGIDNSNNKIILDYVVQERKLKLETLKKYKVGFSFEKFAVSEGKYYNLPCISYPLFIPCSSLQVIKPSKEDINQDVYDFFNCDNYYLTKVKLRAIGKELKHFQRIEPTGALLQGLFGVESLDSIPNEDSEIVITEGEYDAMAVYQETGLPTVSLPNGSSNLPNDLLPFFSQFKKIYLWTDADQAGKIAAENFSKKLGVRKTYIVNTRKHDPNGPKDANDCLKMGLDLNKYLKEAKMLAGENVIRFDDIRTEILQFLSQYDQFSGYKSNSFEFFNERLKGLRPGEFTILTGETGCGKTTFLAQLSLDFLEQRIPTLWGSFEIKNEKLASMFLMQLAKKDLRQTSIPEIEYYSDQFEKLPLYFLKFHGSQIIDEIMNSLQFAVTNYDIQVIVLDNLQFMTGSFTKINKFDYQDEIIHKLRLFATEKNVHILLVIHPKKTDEAIKINSIFGTGKASQEADNILIIQNYKGLRIIEVAKNRFVGNHGKSVLGFDKGSCRYFEVDDKSFLAYSKGEVTLEELAENFQSTQVKENVLLDISKYDQQNIQSSQVSISDASCEVFSANDRDIENRINNADVVIQENEEEVNSYNVLNERNTISIQSSGEEMNNTVQKKSPISSHEGKQKKNVRNVNPDSFLIGKAEKVTEQIKESELNKEEKRIKEKLKEKELVKKEEASNYNNYNSKDILPQSMISEQENERGPSSIMAQIEQNLHGKNTSSGNENNDIPNSDSPFQDTGFIHNSVIPKNGMIENFHTEESRVNSQQFTQQYNRYSNKDEKRNTSYRDRLNVKDKVLLEGLI
eukprot:CAMPEP_0170536638 /NCGR_PEP_ID=MMETSP0209-20121228/102259_1 /TAXON_ID=665100 ORGANISM="Litonotus pictus, Strain P1" /NCGR_SAMPLE_ID=MMETSP0209 /ASSEMBLY_ACC=CAM_ASM_000301 /LENGTH=999 /DNA_ID=CAMNT_0010838021 /DNA_START=326 /DNA_END=3325 /DNA_ORIENTATION=+